MLRFLILLLAFSLTGCALGVRSIKSDTIAFDDVIEDTTNKMLLLNVLRARDKAPLHFADIPVIRESLPQSYNVGLSKIIGTQRNTTVRDTLVLGGTFGATPSFDLNHLNSKEFATGIASAIDPKIVKYWLDRGLDRRIVLLLFFSAVEIVETPAGGGPQRLIRIMNSPRDAIDIIRRREQPLPAEEELRCDGQSDFERYLKLFNSLNRFFAHAYRERRLLARGMNLDHEKDGKSLQGFAALDQNKVQLVYDKGLGAYSLYAMSPEPKVAFCFHDDSRPGAASQFEFITAGAAGGGDRRNCSQAVVDTPPEDSTRAATSEAPVFFAGPKSVTKPTDYCSIFNRFTIPPAASGADAPRLELRLYIRSVGEIFQFLGDLVQYQDEVKRQLEANPRTPLRLNTPVTFGYCGDTPTPGCDDIFFRLDGQACNARFSLDYRNHSYFVANYNPPPSGNACNLPHPLPRDHSLEVLAVLHQLVGINKSASDVKATPFVQVLP
jgi:hypothetical protein